MDSANAHLVDRSHYYEYYPKNLLGEYLARLSHAIDEYTDKLELSRKLKQTVTQLKCHHDIWLAVELSSVIKQVRRRGRRSLHAQHEIINDIASKYMNCGPDNIVRLIVCNVVRCSMQCFVYHLKQMYTSKLVLSFYDHLFDKYCTIDYLSGEFDPMSQIDTITYCFRQSVIDMMLELEELGYEGAWGPFTPRGDEFDLSKDGKLYVLYIDVLGKLKNKDPLEKVAHRLKHFPTIRYYMPGRGFIRDHICGPYLDRYYGSLDSYRDHGPIFAIIVKMAEEINFAGDCIASLEIMICQNTGKLFFVCPCIVFDDSAPKANRQTFEAARNYCYDDIIGAKVCGSRNSMRYVDSLKTSYREYKRTGRALIL